MDHIRLFCLTISPDVTVKYQQWYNVSGACAKSSDYLPLVHKCMTENELQVKVHKFILIILKYNSGKLSQGDRIVQQKSLNTLHAMGRYIGLVNNY